MGLEEPGSPWGHLSLHQHWELSPLRSQGVIMAFWAFPQGSLGPWGILIKEALWFSGGKHRTRTQCRSLFWVLVQFLPGLGWFAEQRKWRNRASCLGPKAKSLCFHVSHLEFYCKTSPRSSLLAGAEMIRKPPWKSLLVSWIGVMPSLSPFWDCSEEKMIDL